MLITRAAPFIAVFTAFGALANHFHAAAFLDELRAALWHVEIAEQHGERNAERLGDAVEDLETCGSLRVLDLREHAAADAGLSGNLSDAQAVALA